MKRYCSRSTALAAALLAAATFDAEAAPSADLIPHRAVYDLAMTGQTSSDFESIDGRIVVEMTRNGCERFDLEYRFVARFVSDQELIVIDQEIQLAETADGDRLDFSNRSRVDGLENQASIGEAATRNGQTTVTYQQPADKSVEIGATAFPIAHTRNLIEAAKAGDFIVETPIFDGDPEAENETRSTSFISSVPKEGEIAGAAKKEASGPKDEAEQEKGSSAAPAAALPSSAEEPGADILGGLDRWRISEAYYDQTGNADGEPDFSTSYTLYENGVSDDLLLNFDGYSLSGTLAEFTPLERPDCKG